MRIGNINRRGQGIVAAVLIVLIAAVIGVTAASLLGTDVGSSLNYMQSQQAFFIAEAGLEYYLEYLQGQTGSWASLPSPPSNMAFGRGKFSISTANAQTDSIDVTSTAQITGMDGVNTVRLVSVRATRQPGIPDAFRYLMRGDSPGGVSFTNSTGTVTGDLSSAGTIAGIPNPFLTLNGTKYPNTTLTFPGVDFDSYQAIADTTISGNYTFAADTTYNGIYYITGNVTFQNGAKLYGTLVNPSANKTITLDNTTGVVIDPTQDPFHPGGNYPAIVAAGFISATTTANLTTKRLIYTSKNANPSINFRYSSSFNFNGSIVSGGGVDVRDNTNLSMTFDTGILTNPPPNFTGGTQTVGSSLWDELY